MTLPRYAGVIFFTELFVISLSMFHLDLAKASFQMLNNVRGKRKILLKNRKEDSELLWDINPLIWRWRLVNLSTHEAETGDNKNVIL